MVDLELAVDLAPAGRDDDLDRTVDYGSLAGRVAELGGTVTRLNLKALPPGAELVVNCSQGGAAKDTWVVDAPR